MSKITEFSIHLDSQQQVFYPGSQVSGYVVLNLIQPMDMRGLRIEIEGGANCHWTEEDGTGDNKRTVSYDGNEKYFNLVSCLFGNLSNAPSHTLSHPEGRHTYHFNFTLPTPLPSSFEGEHGHIRYLLKAQIDIPWRFDIKIKQPIIINEIIDTNLMQYRQGPSGEEHKTVGCCCWKAGPLDVSVNIDRGGYCPGEVIFINAEVNNKSTRDMNGMKARLYQNVNYHANGINSKTKNDWKVVTQLKGPQVKEGQYAKWENQPFGIPALPPSITNSRVITISYEIQVEVDVPCGFDPCIKMPIVLGTVPYEPTYGQSVSYYGTPEDPKFAPAANFVHGSDYPPPQPSLFGYPNMVPPSYSAAIGVNTVHIEDDDDMHAKGELNYVPVYTFAKPYDGNKTPYPLANTDKVFTQPQIQNPLTNKITYPSSSSLLNEQSSLKPHFPSAPPPE